LVQPSYTLNRLHAVGCGTVAETKGFERARLGKAMLRDLEQACRC
jgi:hypothetical protein